MADHYYEGHEAVYQRLKEKGCRTWDEYLGQAAAFQSFCMKEFMEAALGRSEFSQNHPLALELGCGTGPACCFLAKKGFQVEGIDISSTAVEIAKKEAEDQRFNIEYRVGDICKDDLHQQRYDLVVDGHCLHCIVTPAERRTVLASVYRAIRPGGYFWMETMVADAATDFGKDTMLDDEGVLWVKISKSGQFDLERQINDDTYVANRRVYYDASSLESELLGAGFVISWSDTISPEKTGATGTFQAICKVN